MNKTLKKAAAFAVAAASIATVAGLTACTPGEASDVNIVIGVQQTSGNNYEAMCNFLDDIKDDLGFTYKTVLLESRDNNKNLTTFQNEILGGANGIISMVDMDAANLSALLEYCEQNNVYYGGYMSDFPNAVADESLINNPYLVGSVSDGETDGNILGQYLFDAVVKSDARTVVFTRFPAYAYPAAIDSVNAFKELAEEYNATHDDDFSFPAIEGGDAADGAYVIDFAVQAVPDANITEWHNKGVDAIVSVNSLAKRILPALTQNNINDVGIYSAGWDDSIIDSFGDNKPVKTLCQTPCETIVYPLVRIINAVRGNSYSDEPTGADKIITGHYVYLTGTQDLEDGKENCMNFSDDRSPSRALINADGIKSLLAGEEGATFAKLKDTIESWDTEYVLRRQ